MTLRPCAWFTAPARPAGTGRVLSMKSLVTAEWLADNAAQVHLFDSRLYMDGRDGRQEFERGHIPGAVYVDIDTDLSAPPAQPGQPGGRHPFPTAKHFASAMGRLGYDGSAPAVVYDDVGGGMAARLWFMLKLIEVPAAVLDGGTTAWQGVLETGPAQVDPVDFAVRAWPADRLVDADEVARRLAAGGVVADARNPSRYAGKPNRIDPRFGHIPGAINLAWEDNIDDFTGRFLAVESLRERFAPMLADTGERPVAYCGSGVTACHDLLALDLLGAQADLYVGSWSEWGADTNRPIQADQTD